MHAFLFTLWLFIFLERSQIKTSHVGYSMILWLTQLFQPLKIDLQFFHSYRPHTVSRTKLLVRRKSIAEISPRRIVHKFLAQGWRVKSKKKSSIFLFRLSKYFPGEIIQTIKSSAHPLASQGKDKGFFDLWN